MPCRNGGTCFNSGPDGFICQCTPGFTGTTCTTPNGECATEPCLNGATCKVWFSPSWRDRWNLYPIIMLYDIFGSWWLILSRRVRSSDCVSLAIPEETLVNDELFRGLLDMDFEIVSLYMSLLLRSSFNFVLNLRIPLGPYEYKRSPVNKLFPATSRVYDYNYDLTDSYSGTDDNNVFLVTSGGSRGTIRPCSPP